MAPEVLFINHVGVVGGAEESLLVLLGALDPARYRARLAAPLGELAVRAAALEVPCWPLPPGRLRRGSPVQRVRSLAWLGTVAGRLATGLPAALLHANSAAAALAALPLAVSRRLPLLWHVRDVRLPASVVRALAPHATAVAISRYVAADLLRAGWSPQRLAVIPNAIDPEAVQPRRSRAVVRAELGLDSADEVVIAVGQFVPWKRHDLLLAAAAQLAPTRPRLRLVLVGDDRFGEHPELLARYRAAAASPPLAGRVVLTGQRRDVPDLLAAADLMVLPSAGEPFGRVVLEALAVGTPQVVAAPSGAAEVVLPGVTGLLAPHGQPAALAAIVARLLDDPARRAAMARASRERAALFCPAASAEAVMALYDRSGRKAATAHENRRRGAHDAC